MAGGEVFRLSLERTSVNAQQTLLEGEKGTRAETETINRSVDLQLDASHE
jgi:hypothetical protein